ncbi:MAG: VTT domain-containing protein [Chloroflexi bacterium]|nr:VTT domain-containing protein [Chloroflexota bacterium]
MEEEATPAPAPQPAEVAEEEARSERRRRPRIKERLPGRLRAVPTPVLLGTAAAVIFVIAALVSVLPLVLGVSQEDLENLGYPGVFIANFLGTATLFFPVPGLTAGGQLLIVTLADSLNPVAVALLGGAGMAVAEVTAYAAGRGLRELSAERKMPVRGRIGRWLRGAAGLVDRLMMRYGVPTLLVLAAVPNPFFEFAGITAGAVRMAFWRFFVPVAVGKVSRAFLLAFIGKRFLDLFT